MDGNRLRVCAANRLAPCVALLAAVACSNRQQATVAIAAVPAIIFEESEAIAYFSGSAAIDALINDGPCSFAAIDTSSNAVANSAFVSAGAITIRGTAGQPLVLQPTGSDYYSGSEGVYIFQAGDAVSFSAAGAQVPAFATTATAPARAASADLGITNGSISRAGDLQISWAPVSGADQFRVLWLGSPGVLDCEFDPTAGTGVIPASAIQNFPSGTLVTLVPGTVNHTQAVAGDWSVDVVVAQAVTYASATVQ